VEQDGQRLQAWLPPLYGEVRRARTGQLRARRLRGQIATALTCSGARRADDTLRRAFLALDSSPAADPFSLTPPLMRRAPFRSSANRATGQGCDGPGGGFDSQLTLAHAPTWHQSLR
jgi:hypothetical protein